MDIWDLIVEDSRRRDIIRQIIKDIITIYKSEEEGEYYLPDEVDENRDFYIFSDTGAKVRVELTIQENPNRETFKIDASYYRRENIIEVIIDYNPEKKEKIIYDLIGQLNELIAHEIRHVDQKHKGIYNLEIDEPEDPYEYYTQPHELDAQYFGFKRMSKMTKKPMEVLVRQWFENNYDLHQLEGQQKEDVINKILNFRK
jgi:hypothetical protein